MPSGIHDQSLAALKTPPPPNRSREPTALFEPPASVWVYAVVRTRIFFPEDLEIFGVPVAQPTRLESAQIARSVRQEMRWLGWFMVNGAGVKAGAFDATGGAECKREMPGE